MPCRDDWPDNRVPPDPYADVKARLACAYVNDLLAAGKELPDWAAAWWKHHTYVDAQRRANEEAAAKRREHRRKALGKLSAEERDALGIKE